MHTVLIVDDNVELASLLAMSVEAHGFAPVVAHTGRAALEAIAAMPVDAALVDLMLPDVRGTAVLDALAARGIPALAMSGVFRGDPFAREATAVHGAKAFFEKPFVAREMMALLHALLNAGPAADAVDGMLPDDELLLETLEPLEELEPLDEDEEELTQEDAFRQPVAAAGPVPDDLPATTGIFARKDPIAVALEDEQPIGPPAPPAPHDDSLGALAYSNRDPWKPARRAVPTTSSAAWERAGDLARTSVARLLTALHQGQQTGELRVRRGEVVKVVVVENGRPVYAASNLADERFGRFAVRMGGLEPGQLASAQREATRAGMRTGEAMVALGLMTNEKRRTLIERQVEEIIWSLLDWTGGQYAFVPGRPGRRDLVPLSFFPGDLVLEGFRRTLTLVRLRQLVPTVQRVSPTGDPPYQLHELTLSGPEALLLAYADGSKTVEDLMALSELDERGALAVIHALVQLGILEPRTRMASDRRVVLV